GGPHRLKVVDPDVAFGGAPLLFERGANVALHLELEGLAVEQTDDHQEHREENHVTEREPEAQPADKIHAPFGNAEDPRESCHRASTPLFRRVCPARPACSRCLGRFGSSSSATYRRSCCADAGYTHPRCW